MSSPKKIKMVCHTCGSTEVRRNADVRWNYDKQEWEIVAIFDNATCEKCEGECKIDEK